jgi:tRNA threonylcarbamoyladenosine biosynthesis protein TsaE
MRTLIYMKLVCHSLEDTADIARDFVANELKAQDGHALLVCLYGNLGAGKTTFTQLVAKELGVKELLTSPTFVIEKIYKIEAKGFERLIHIDAYRLESGAELAALGWSTLLKNPKNIIFLEWPERVADVLPDVRKNLCFEFISDKQRGVDLRYDAGQQGA